MLSTRFYRAVGILVPIFFHMGNLGLSWNPTILLFELPPKRKRLVYINALVLWAYCLLLVYQLILAYKRSDYNTFNLLFTFIIAYLISLESFICTVYLAEEAYFTLNYVLVFLRKANRK